MADFSNVDSTNYINGRWFDTKGTHIVIAQPPTSSGVGIEKSNDNGDTFTTLSPPMSRITSIRVSEDGQNIFIFSTIAQKFYISSDGGANWTQQLSGIISAIEWLQCSNSGQYVIFSRNGADMIYVSNDYGATVTGTSMKTIRCDMDSTGQYMGVAGIDGQDIIFNMSNDFGVTWTQQTISGNGNNPLLSISADGQYILITSANNNIYRSTDYGVSFSEVSGTTQAWEAIEISVLDPKYQYAALWNQTNTVWESVDYGETWTAKYNHPSAVRYYDLVTSDKYLIGMNGLSLYLDRYELHDPNAPPEITSTPPSTIYTNKEFTYNITVNHSESQIIYLISDLSWLSITDNTIGDSLIANYRFDNASNLGECSVNSANDLILFDNANIITDTFNDSPLSYNSGANFSSNTDGKGLITNNINFGNSTYTVSFWAKQPSSDQCLFFSQGHNSISTVSYGSSGSGKLYLKINNSVMYPATDDTNITSTGASTSDATALVGSWNMHTIVIRDDGLHKIYINGEFYSSIETANSAIKTFTNELNGYLVIGGQLNTGSDVSNPTEADLSADTNNDYQGYMQDFRIYDRELSAKEISYLFGEEKPQAVIDSNFGLQYGNAAVDEEITKIVYTANSNLDGVSFNDVFKVKIEGQILIAHYEFKDPSNVGKCSVNSANDLILFDSANIVTNTLTDTPLSSQNVADFTGNTDGKALITNNINLGNSTHTISFWAYKTNTAQAFFVSQGHAWQNYFVYSNDTRIKILQQGTVYFPANGDSDAVINQWVMHTIVIRENDIVKKIYINGQLYASIDTKVFENVNNGYLYIGGYLTGSDTVNNPTEADLNADTGKDFQGYMQDLRIYNSELSEENINDLYNSTVEQFTGQEKIVTVDITTDEPPTADTNETIFTIGQTIGDESITTTVDVTLYFTDNGPLTYSVDTNYGAITGTYVFENNNIIYTTDSNMTEDVVDQINIIAQDEVGQTVEKVFTFNIIANNKPEADTNILSYDIYDLTIPVIVDVTDIFSDIDSGDVLTITIDTSYGLTNGTAVIADNNLSYLASVDIKDNRTDEVKLVVTDSFNATAEKILNINISPIIVQSDVNIIVYKNTPKVLNLEDYITSGTLLSSTVDATYGLANGFIRKDSNTPSFSEYNPRLNVIESDMFKIILNNTIELIVNIQMESGIIEANFVEGDTNLIFDIVEGEDPKVDLSQFVSNPAEKPLEIEISQDVLEQINGEINIDSNTNEITYVPDNNTSGPQTIIFEVKIFD